jgi:hypothetical protein
MSAKKILVAEDSSVIQNITKKVLQFQNFEIKSAKNGQQVLKMMDKENFDAILMDINMPLLDGMSCAKKIREMADPAKSATPIIAITGNAQNYSMQDFEDAGINDYLPKPLNFDKLVLTVKKYTK